MKNPTPYLKMRVLGAIDMAEGTSIQARIKNVSALTFTDEEGHARQFTWRTIQTWLTRYKKHGVTALENAPRSDRGKTRNLKPEELLEAIRAVLPKAHGRTPTRALLYRLCIEQGVLTRAPICARVGCLLHHTPVRDGAAKGKVERFFRTVRDQFLTRTLDLSSLEALNRQFTHWVEEHYNAQLHSVLGLSPLDRFALDRSRVRFLPPNEANDELFFVEEERHVRADNTFSFKAVRFEAPRHLPERTIQIRFERKRPTARVVVYYKAERLGEARPLDAIANDRPPAPRSGGPRLPPARPAPGGAA